MSKEIKYGHVKPGSEARYAKYRDIARAFEDLGDRLGAKNAEDANLCYAKAGVYREKANYSRVILSEGPESVAMASQGWHSELNPDAWKEIPGFENYVINFQGQIRIKSSNIVVSRTSNLNNQPIVSLLDNHGVPTVYSVKSALDQMWKGFPNA